MKRKQIVAVILIICLFICSAGCEEIQLERCLVTDSTKEQFVAYPQLLENDDELTEQINTLLRERGQTEAYENLLLSGQGGAAGVHLDYESFILPGTAVLSVCFNAYGKMLSGPPSQRYAAVSIDLATGQELFLDDLFPDADGLRDRIQEYVSAVLEESLSEYMANGDVFPIPWEDFFLCPQGMVLFYDRDQFTFLSDYQGSVLIPYTVLFPNTGSGQLPQVICGAEDYLAHFELSDESALVILAEAADGTLAQLPCRIGDALESSLERLRQVYDSGFYPGGAYYETENALMLRNVLLSDDREETVTGILARNVNWHGLQTGKTLRREILDVLGEPAFSAQFGQSEAAVYLFEPGTVDTYDAGEYSLILNTDENGILSAILLR